MLNAIQNLLPALNEISRKKLLIVTSIGKSGSTWVQKILDAHKDIYCAGEGKFHELISTFFESLDRYNEILSHTNTVIYGNAPYYAPWKDPQRLAATHLLMALAFLTAQKPIPRNVSYIGDKDTSYAHNIELWRNGLLPTSKFIHVIRDGRDVFLSNIAHLNRQGEKITPQDPIYLERLKSWATTWKNKINNTRKACRSAPELYLEVQYEDLLLDPEREAQKMFSFLGVDHLASTLATCCEQTSFKRLSGGRESGRENAGSFFRKGVQGDWKAMLDDEAREIFHREAGDILIALGYTLS